MKKKVALAAIAVILGFSATMHLYFINEGSGPILFWNSDKAYLFIRGGNIGYRMSYLRYLPEPILERFYYVPPPDRQSEFVEVIEITPQDVRHFRFENMGFSDIQMGPMGRYIYAGSNRGLVKWTGNGFERASPEEVNEHMRINYPVKFDNLNGWWGTGPLHDDSQTTMELGGQPVILETKSSGPWPSQVSITLLLPGRNPEKIADCGSRMRRVSRAEYDAVFPN